jgi:hypothetical protein
VLIGAMIWLRPVTADDAQLQADWRNVPEWSGPYQNHWPTSQQEQERGIAEPKLPDLHRYVVIGRDNAEAMGHLQYWNPFTLDGFYRGREIAYAVHPAFPSAYTFSFYGPGVLAWLPAQWVSDGRPGRRRMFGAARHLAVVAEERAQVSSASLAHQTAVPANLQAGPAQAEELDGDTVGMDLV